MTTVIFSTIWLSQWVYSSFFEIIIPIWMFQSLFSLSLHYHRLIRIICSYCFLFSHYCSISIIVLVIHEYGILWYGILFWIGISMIWNKTHVPVYSHFVVVAALHFISFLFQTLILNSFSFHIINQRYWCPFAKPILLLLLLLFVLLFVGPG